MARLDFKLEFKPNTRVIRQMGTAVERAVALTLEVDIIPEAVRRSPHDTGNNRRSISGDVIEVGGMTGGSIQTASGYGAFLELGTLRMPPRPYLVPAVKKGAKRLAANVKELLEVSGG